MDLTLAEPYLRQIRNLLDDLPNFDTAYLDKWQLDMSFYKFDN